MRMLSKRMAGKVNKKKKTVRGGWDSSLTDLSKHQLSSAELERRRLSYVSKNLEAARKDLYEKPKTTGSVAMVTDISNSSIQVKDTPLNFDDRFMKAKYSKGHPNITPAPHLIDNKENLERTLQELTYEGRPSALTSPGGIHDNTLWKRLQQPSPPTVLNEIPPHSTSPEVLGDDPTYEPLINLDRYSSFVQDELQKVNKEVDPVTTLMQQLQLEVQEYEKEVGVVDPAPHQFTSSLESVIKTSLVLVRYLRNAQKELTEERTLQEQLLLTVEEQQSILDTMATDIIQLKEKQCELEKENKRLHDQYVRLQDDVKKGGIHHPLVPMFIPGPHPSYPRLMTPIPHPVGGTTPLPHPVGGTTPLPHPVGGTTPLPHPVGGTTHLSHPLVSPTACKEGNEPTCTTSITPTHST